MDAPVKQRMLVSFELHMRMARRAQVLADMARLVPWLEVVAVDECLHANGVNSRRGTIVNAQIVSAPMSTKKELERRDPELRHTAENRD